MLCIQSNFGYYGLGWYVVWPTTSHLILYLPNSRREPYFMIFTSAFQALTRSYASSFDSQIYNLCASRSCAYFTFVYSLSPFFHIFDVCTLAFETGFVFNIRSVYLVFGFTLLEAQRRESLTHVYFDAGRESTNRKRKGTKINIKNKTQMMEEIGKESTKRFSFSWNFCSQFVLVESFGHYIY